MDNEEFRHEAHALVDWMADYLQDVGSRRIVPQVQPGEIRARLPLSAPEAAEPFAAVMRDFASLILPGMTHWNHPGWFAYFPANHSPPSILAEMLTATLGAQCMSWQTSPAATELEQVVTDWMRQLVGLPSEFRGVIQDTASTSTLVALLCARERATAHAFGRLGAGAPDASRMVVYTSAETHSSVTKGVKLAGFGLENLRLVPVDDAYAMRPSALESALAADVANGRIPACIVATVGTTSSSALDPLDRIGPIAGRHGAWLHVDGAYGGSAAILPEKRSLLAGIEHADSFVFNPHKWLFTNFDCSLFYTRHVPALLATFQTSPEYLRTAHDEAAVNYRDWGIQLGRRFRALKLWFVLRSYGAEGLRRLVREHIRLAGLFRSLVESDPDFEVPAPTPLGLVCFRLRSRPREESAVVDAANQRLLERVNDDGRVYLTHTRLADRFTLRLSIGQLSTREEHVRLAWDLVRAAKDEVGR